MYVFNIVPNVFIHYSWSESSLFSTLLNRVKFSNLQYNDDNRTVFVLLQVKVLHCFSITTITVE